MRVKHTLLNISAGLVNQLIITALSFVSRTVFINSLGIEYLGVNAMFTSILAMLSLAEAGIGSSIVYNLYKPVADQDQSKIQALMKLYKNAYMLIALVVLLLGLGVFPFLDLIVKDTSVEHIGLVYIIFLINTAVPYLFVYKHSFLNVNQKNYLVTAVFSVSSIISTCVKIAIIYYTENYILFLAVESFITITTSIILAFIVDRMYPFLKQKTASKLDPETKANFIKNMKAILIQNIGTYFIFGVDSILISTFISIAAVGFYANYKMLIDICRTFINQVSGNMYHSVGNLVAKENSDTVYRVYKVTLLLNFWLYSLLAIGLYILTEPLITVWIGSEYVMGHYILLVLVIVFFERGMRNSITTVKSTAGIFHEDRFVPLFQAAINLGVSLILVHFLGLVGIFLGGFISALAVPFWTTPYFVFKKVFKQPLHRYFLTYAYYTCIGIAGCLSAIAACSFLPSDSIAWLMLQGVVCVITVNLVYVAIFFKTSEFKYLYGVLFSIFNKIPKIHVISQRLGKKKLDISGNK